MSGLKLKMMCFNTQPPEGGCMRAVAKRIKQERVSTHSHPKVAATQKELVKENIEVSTHSHPKVAAVMVSNISNPISCFNTQPPEGGCLLRGLLRK